MTDASDLDVTRRTHLAAERTCLAWWRTGIATIAAVGSAESCLRWSALFLVAGRRQNQVERALTAATSRS